MTLTEHAQARAAERFPAVDMAAAWRRARRCKSHELHAVRQACPQSAARFMARKFAGRFVLVTDCGIVFVVDAPDTVVTVFPLKP